MIEDTTSQDLQTSPSPVVAEKRGVPFLLQVGGIVLLIGVVLVGYARWQTGSMRFVLPYLQGQRLLFAETQIDLGAVSDEIIDRQIHVANLSSQPLTLLGVQKSCGCISMEEFPIVIPKGGSHDLRMKIHVTDRSGQFAIALKFFSDLSTNSSVVVNIDGFVP